MKDFQSKNQQGIVSITVAVVFIMVISLTVMGFSQVSRRNSQASLDRQLSAQAYYAAESAINDVISEVAKIVQAGEGDIPEQTKCSDSTKYTKNDGNLLGEGIRYTCLKVKAKLNTLVYDQVTSQTITVPINADSGSIGSNKITWTRAKTAPANLSVGNCPARTSLPTAAEWVNKCPFGLLRVDILPITPGATGTLGNADNAAANTMTLFLYPKSGSGTSTVRYRGSTFDNAFGTKVNQGVVLDAQCDNETCSATVDNLDFSNAFMRVQSIYTSASNLQIAAPAGKSLVGSQVEIDATGKAQDVLRRLKVRYPLLGSSRADVPGFSSNALQSAGSICKYFTVAPGYFSNKDTACGSTVTTTPPITPTPPPPVNPPTNPGGTQNTDCKAGLVFCEDFEKYALGVVKDGPLGSTPFGVNWLNNQSCPNRVTIEKDPVTGVGKSVKMAVHNTDVKGKCPAAPNENPRAQLLSKPIFREGDDYYISVGTYFPSDFPRTIGNKSYLQVTQIYGGPSKCGPPIGIFVVGDRFQLNQVNAVQNTSNCTGVTRTTAAWKSNTPIVYGSAWNKIVMHIKFSTNPSVGFIEIWQNGQKQKFSDNLGSKLSADKERYYTAAIVEGVNYSRGGSTNLHVNSYRGATAWDGFVTLWHDDVKVGKTYESVQ